MLLRGRELEIYKWEGDAEELLRGVREKLNALGAVDLYFSLAMLAAFSFVLFCVFLGRWGRGGLHGCIA